MLKSNIRETGSSGQPATGMTIREVMEQCKMLYFAGTATPSTLLTWTMVLLCMHPESGRIVQGRRPLAYLERSIPSTAAHAKIPIYLWCRLLRFSIPTGHCVHPENRESEIGASYTQPEWSSRCQCCSFTMIRTFGELTCTNSGQRGSMRGSPRHPAIVALLLPSVGGHGHAMARI
jgi:hypothetical protein